MEKYIGIQHILSNMRKAIDTYNMNDEGDKIAVALSRWKRFYYYANWIKTFADFLSESL